MNNPQLYVLAGEGDSQSDWVVLNNLEWGKEQALKTAKKTLIPQTIYKLVPIYEIEVKTVHEFPIKEPHDDRRDWDAADKAEGIVAGE